MSLIVYGVLHFTRKFIHYLCCYIAVFASGLSSTVQMIQTPDLSNIFLIYYLMNMALVFMKLLPWLISAVWGCILVIYMFTAQKDVLHLDLFDLFQFGFGADVCRSQGFRLHEQEHVRSCPRRLTFLPMTLKLYLRTRLH
jgi:hypothetical protein